MSAALNSVKLFRIFEHENEDETDEMNEIKKKTNNILVITHIHWIEVKMKMLNAHDDDYDDVNESFKKNSISFLRNEKQWFLGFE